MPRKIHILLSEISLRNICQKTKSKRPSMNRFMKLLCQDHYPSILNLTESGVEVPVLFKKNLNFKSHLLNLELLKKDKCLHLNFVDTMIVEICLFEWIIKILCLNWLGRFQYSHWIIIIICLFFLMVRDRNLILIDHLLF
jgi:hypothetical protein